MRTSIEKLKDYVLALELVRDATNTLPINVPERLKELIEEVEVEWKARQ